MWSYFRLKGRHSDFKRKLTCSWRSLTWAFVEADGAAVLFAGAFAAGALVAVDTLLATGFLVAVGAGAGLAKQMRQTKWTLPIKICTAYTVKPRPEVHMDMILFEVFLKSIELIPPQQILQGTIYFIDNVIVLSDLVESSGYSSKTLQKGSCPYAPEKLDEVLQYIEC